MSTFIKKLRLPGVLAGAGTVFFIATRMSTHGPNHAWFAVLTAGCWALAAVLLPSAFGRQDA